MNEQQTPQKKKGLGPLAWIAIGCGALILIAMLLMSAGLWFGGKMVKNVVQDLEENPAKTVAKGIVMANPELEMVETDDDAGTITVRMKETGEVATFDYSEIKEGKLRFESSEGTMTFDASGAAEEGAVFKVETEEGTAEWGTLGEPSDLPGWLPRYPSATEMQTAFHEQKAGKRSGTFSFQTSDSPQQVFEFYREGLEGAGMTVQETTTTVGGAIQGGSLTATDDDPERQTTLTITQEGDTTRVGVFYSDVP